MADELADALTPIVEVKPRRLSVRFTAIEASLESPADALIQGFGNYLADSLLNPERAPTAPYVRPATPTSLDELVGRTDWACSECYCVHCGQQPVIVESGCGDYYLGPTYHCLTCHGEFCLG